MATDWPPSFESNDPKSYGLLLPPLLTATIIPAATAKPATIRSVDAPAISLAFAVLVPARALLTCATESFDAGDAAAIKGDPTMATAAATAINFFSDVILKASLKLGFVLRLRLFNRTGPCVKQQ
jgi:hypothetical protein